MKFTHRGSSHDAISYWSDVIRNHIPEDAVCHVAHLMATQSMQFHISRPRVSKFGHYRMAHQGKPHLISVNIDLSPERFLLTLVHEIAHMTAYVEHGRKISPHGKEWKSIFREHMSPLVTDSIFPTHILPLLEEHLNSPKATSCSDQNLHKAFEKLEGKEYHTLEELPAGAVFRIRTGRTFIKGEKKRTRFLCTEKPRGGKYLIHGACEITQIVHAQKALF